LPKGRTGRKKKDDFFLLSAWLSTRRIRQPAFGSRVAGRLSQQPRQIVIVWRRLSSRSSSRTDFA
jgi:hypothetical protein